MATTKFTVPNWEQGLIAQAVGLDPGGIAVRADDDKTIVMLEHKTRKEYIVDKVTGKVLVI